MTIAAPLVDARTADDIASQVKALLREYAPAYTGAGTDPITGELVPDPHGAALIGVFARFAELVIERLNRVPDKNLLAFLDLLGASRLAPQPARVPLTFSLAKGSTSPGVVPPGTQVASPPGEGESDPVVFETERELVVSPAVLTTAFARDPDVDAYADLGAIVAGGPASGVRVFRGNRLIEHSAYFGQRQLLGFNGITNLRVTFGLPKTLTADRTVEWEAWDGTAFKTISRGEDTTDNLRTSGAVNMGALDPVPLSTIHGIESRWLRCRLVKVINISGVDRDQMVRADDLPVIESITSDVSVSREDLPIDTAFTNATPIDATRDFFPFGETPRFGDAFYLRADEPFSTSGATVRVHVTLTNPKGSGSRNPSEVTTSDVTLNWEIGNGSAWLPLGTAKVSDVSDTSTASFKDGTAALTQSGDIEFVCPAAATTIVNGTAGFWIRARIVGGDYGHEARYVKQGDAFVFDPATFAPPIVTTARVSYSHVFSAGPDAVLTFNDFTFEDVSARHDREGESFAPFVPSADTRPTAYFGFELPAGVTAFPNRAVSVFARTADIRFGEPVAPAFPTVTRASGSPGAVVTHRITITNDDRVPVVFAFGAVGNTFQPHPQFPGPITLAPGASADVEVTVRIPDDAPIGASDAAQLVVLRSTDPARFEFVTLVTTVDPAGDRAASAEPVRLVWEYWNGKAFAALTMLDGTESLTRSGTLEFLAPRDFAARPDFSLGARFWIRVRWDRGDYPVEPRLVRLLLNTTIAAQTVTRRAEVLGSSDGSKNPIFRATRTPILAGQQLEVREPELPTAAERHALEREEGADAITPVTDGRGPTKNVFVRWHETPDFYASGPRDRHYVIDRFTGEIRFGDGRNGLVPPAGVGNIRLARYQTGGGRAGNRAAGTITQLKTTVPYVDKVTNHEPAVGGADAEPLDVLLDRAPREVRHGGRAVTIEDYEDVAHLASPEVARAKCVPLSDLLVDALDPAPATPGDVSVIIVPRSTDPKPLPSVELIRRVQEFLDGVRLPTAHLTVVGPLYVRVDVAAEIALASLDRATDVVADVRLRVASFLHPLTGGLDGKGWDFGRRPHLSDLYALIEAVPGVDHIRALEAVEVEDVPGTTLTGRFLVYSGEPAISAVLEDV